MKTIDTARALHLLREVVAEQGPDYVYKRVPASEYGGCVYFHPTTSEPSCIVGRALAKEGLKPSALTGYQNEAVRIRVLADRALPGAGLLVTDDAARVFSAAQEAQDDGKTWGESLRWAETAAKQVAQDL